MSSPVFLPSSRVADELARREAISPTRSFAVRAPAGSGKTELLIQRFLALLAVVERPEAIVAITFTKKAAAEMRGRILRALREAQEGKQVSKPHEAITRELALAALKCNDERGWALLSDPARLRVQTIDSLCMSIAGEMPWLSRLGAMPGIEEDTRELYEEAARRTLLTTLPEHADHIDVLLEHLDNNAAVAQTMIAGMLAKRDQWIEWVLQTEEDERRSMEDALARTIESRLEEAARAIPSHSREAWLGLARYAASNLEKRNPLLIDIEKWPEPRANNVEIWLGLLEILLTKSGGWRKSLDARCGFPAHNKAKKEEGLRLIGDLQTNPHLLDALKAISELPPPRYSEEQWMVLRALLKTLHLAVGELWMVFRERRTIDFCQLGLSARWALGDESNPTNLAYRLDSRIEHLLIDEFQDTSRGQFELAQKLTSDWQPGDGRTLFLVGDPMQSIYRFRQAEVGLFVHMEKRGLGNLLPEPLQLMLNHRSVPAIVNRVNQLFTAAFPSADDIETGAIAYCSSEASQEESVTVGSSPQLALFSQESPAVSFDVFLDTADKSSKGDDRAAADAAEARRVIQRIRNARDTDPNGSIAILVRARTHLPKIIETLQANGLAYSAVEIDALEERSIVRDLLALTRAMLHPADRISWLAILRAPWCGLTLPDLEALVYEKHDPAALPDRRRHRRTVWECLADSANLSEDGAKRARHVRDVLAEAFAEQGRWPLRRWLERAWIKLGGASVIAGDAQALDHAASYFDTLEAAQQGCDLPDLDQFEKRIAQIMARPTAESGPGTLSVMTIHKAKGLQFDTVIVPGMGRTARNPGADEPLLLYHEWMEDGKLERLIAPVSQRRGEQDPLYRYLKKVETRKDDFERLRQIYVAMTRATKRLHLLGSVRKKNNGDISLESRSMLADLWPAMTDEEKTVERIEANASLVSETRTLRRLAQPLSFLESLPGLPKPVDWPQSVRSSELHDPSFEWVGENLRHAGTVVHGFLQRVTHHAETGLPQMPEPAAIRAALIHAGVVQDDLDLIADRVERALRRTFASDRGCWILAQSHQDARTEYAMAAASDADDSFLSGMVDRTFIDQSGVRWIVDFKTSLHEGSGLEKFLDEQQRRYRDQMERYARILQPLGNPVRVGLYFPLLDEWREWSPQF